MRRRALVLSSAFVLSFGSAVAGGAAGAAAETPIPIECEGDNCQTLPPPPEEPTLGTAFLTPEVDPPPHVVKPGTGGGKKHHRPRHPKGHGHHHKKGHGGGDDRGRR
jgi:hypothetical protein